MKRFADQQSDRAGAVWLTGSQRFEVMQGVRETLAGRMAILNLFGLSDEEKRLPSGPPSAYFECLWQTSFPKIAGANWQPGRVISLGASHPDAAPHVLAPEWRLASPLDLSFLAD
ncbi:MAG: hypothetical protein H7A45_20595 [Verrucomicrobiales bacterium]|nr:hypothetical protein [Verrucomicrobiales bacterium]